MRCPALRGLYFPGFYGVLWNSSNISRKILGAFSPGFMGGNQTYLFEFGDFRLDPAERQLLRSGKVVPLTPKALELLCLLVENGGHLLGKDRLMETLWADAFVEEGNLADNISKIRQVLGDSRKEPKYIETVSGRGYRFVADVRRIEQAGKEQEDKIKNETAISESSAVGSGNSDLNFSHGRLQENNETEFGSLESEISPAPKPATDGRRRNRFGLVTLAILGILVLGAAGFFLWRENGRSADSPIRSIAVLPFKPLAANSRDESLELGMSDSLITGLGSVRQIAVRPISAVRRYTDLEQDAAAAGRELQVDSVLEGNIQRDGDQIRITARLVRAKDGKTLWTEAFDETFTNIFAVQDLISQRIVGALALQLSGHERDHLTKKYTTNTEAYQLYLKGRYFWNKATPDGFQKSISFYTRAIEIDPNYALAYAGLADAYNLLGSYGVLPIKESHPKARAAAEKALLIDGELAEAHTSLAAVIADYYWDWTAAESHFKQAIDLNPNYPVARYWHSQHLARMGRLDESIEEARVARQLDPVSSHAIAHVGLALYRARRYDEAIAELQKALEIDPKTLDAHILLGFVYVQQKKSEEAIREFQTVAELSERNPSLLALLGYGYGTAGKRGDAEAIRNELATNLRPYPFEIAMINIGLGEQEQAFEWLHKAYNERAWQLGFLKVEPLFDPLRGDPRFAELLRQINLEP